MGCAVCEVRPGVVPMPDGRRFCVRCSQTVPKLGRRTDVPMLDAWDRYVTLKEGLRARRRDGRPEGRSDNRQPRTPTPDRAVANPRPEVGP